MKDIQHKLSVARGEQPAELLFKNARLVNVLSAEIVPHRFHARHDAVARRYLYQVARRRTAFAKAYVWWVKEPLDLARMREAAQVFVGMRDFQSFVDHDADADDAPRAQRSTLVLVERLEIAEDGDLILIGIEGSHFLWKMVRRIVGVLVEIGRGKLDAADAARFLTEASDAPARLTAPASGLFLERVSYKDDERSRDDYFRSDGVQLGPNRVPRTSRTTSA